MLNGEQTVNFGPRILDSDVSDAVHMTGRARKSWIAW